LKGAKKNKMKKLDLSKIAKGVRCTLSKHSPEILTGLGLAGMVTTVVLAVRATPKALVLIQEAEIKKTDEQVKAGAEPDEICSKLTVGETVKATWKCYIPNVTSGLMSTICIIGASSVHSRRNAALATAYSLSETALKEYQEKVVETIGEKKEKTIRDAVAKDRLDRDPVTNREVIITSKGDTLCYDSLSKRYFTSDIDKLRKIENDLNRNMRDDMFISVNDLYYEFGLEPIEQGDYLGWDIDKEGYIDMTFSSHVADDGRPCLVVGYMVAPRWQK
jgi:hypothetical protein